MECFKNRLCQWISIELAALIMFIICIILQIINGSKFSINDIVFVTVVLVVCLTILILTVYFFANSGSSEDKRKLVDVVTEEKEICRKLRPLHKMIESDCPICLATMQCSSLVQLSCAHDYHEKCVKEWFVISRDFRCPQCREECQDFSSCSKGTETALNVV
ncbi:RING finger protein 150-like [Saccostrea echinata]|uniref:RING finger protein 150-like n=1 Tax=Saccostrea echinata TaxID=191078 RepID=UPI002A7FA230|nr:RING finger protein 150-like [Saccostrea echinata]